MQCSYVTLNRKKVSYSLAYSLYWVVDLEWRDVCEEKAFFTTTLDFWHAKVVKKWTQEINITSFIGVARLYIEYLDSNFRAGVYCILCI